MLIRPSQKFYELYGILLGDGCLSKFFHQKKWHFVIRIDGNAETDRIYYTEHVIPLIKDITGRDVKLKERKDCNGTYLSFECKKLFEFFENRYDFPVGKKGKIKIHDSLSDRWSALKHILRGLMDTDGSLYFTKNNSDIRRYPIIEISSHSSPLLEQLKNILIEKGFRVKIHAKYGDSIKLHGKLNLNKWFREIGSSHIDKISKHTYWRNFGHCPKITDLNLSKRLKYLGLVAQVVRASSVPRTLCERAQVL